MSKIINKKQLDLVIESTMAEMGLKMEKEEKCPECGGIIKEGLCEAGCGSDYMEEADAKPDFLDLDKDGDKEEPMKKAAKERDEVEESVKDLAESVTKTFNPSFLTEDMDNFKKLINYRNK